MLFVVSLVIKALVLIHAASPIHVFRPRLRPEALHRRVRRADRAEQTSGRGPTRAQGGPLQRPELGARLLGYANPRGRDISICALPPEVSLTRFLVRGQSPEMFGAVRGCQWPEVAVRRFLLYDVLLHEIGHLRAVNVRARSERQIYAREKFAQKFGDGWRRCLWSVRYDHPDPVHNRPSVRELNLSKLLKMSRAGATLTNRVHRLSQ